MLCMPGALDDFTPYELADAERFAALVERFLRGGE